MSAEEMIRLAADRNDFRAEVGRLQARVSELQGLNAQQAKHVCELLLSVKDAREWLRDNPTLSAKKAMEILGSALPPGGG